MIKVKVRTKYKSKRVTDAAERAKRRFLFQFGGFCKTTARRSIKAAPKARKKGAATRGRPSKKPQVAPRGKPPYYRNKGRGLRSIEFEVDRRSRWVKIGPVRLSGTSKRTSRVAASSLEFGGPTTYRTKKRKRVRFVYHEHPFMGPAGRKTVRVISQRPGSFI